MALRIVIGDVTIGIQGQDFSYIFSVGCGGMESLYKDGKEWLYRTPRPAFWRAVTDNDRGCGFAFRSAVWSAADRFVRCSRVEARMDGEEIAIPLAPANNKYTGKETCDRFEMIYTYDTPTVPATEVTVTYTVETDGRIHVQAEYRGQQGLPELPEFGLRLLMPGKAESYTWEGLSGETYPDRKKGGTFGVHTGTPEAAHYLVPQECGNHADTCQAQIGDLRIVMDGEPFHLSVLPYTPEELENATHRDELPDTGRTVVSILGRMRGVGGIDSWGSDVEPPYRIPADQDIKYAFYLMK